ncbi:MFS transporter [Variovorax arabinosiphilus]|uniref:MFS transporter n=1 Tax=Variovorax arabinosiphilus TaxID=3053498 RepID=UPI002577CACB|nr:MULTISPECIES: MFS transporter [unclassified Variovorax]MDM0120575.1 MFS transporter [Variovorax sp. J2L1-78]MDM0127513.1 MFS transporter [Variovorax sp. J2L1-63]MDM0231212.1 MFS transporter [Variovorax sp. J2R1-6]
MTGGRSSLPPATLAALFAGVSAALHLGKLPPAVSALQVSLGIGLVEAGFLLALVQVAGMTLGLLAGLAADAIGLRRSMLIGLVTLTVASVLGGAIGVAGLGAADAVHALLGLRALEGLGFLMVVMPAPALIRITAPPDREKSALGWWGAYMPLGVAAALLIGPFLIGTAGWPAWWWTIAAVSGAAALSVALCVPGDDAHGSRSTAARAASWSERSRSTLCSTGPWLVAAAFAVYSSQWIAVIGFLPAIYAGAGVPAQWSAVLTALAAAMNIGGNVLAGRWLQRGVPAGRLLRWGYTSMAIGAVVAFAQVGAGGDAVGLPPLLRYLAICGFSLAGGMVPATLFVLAVRVAPGASTVATTVGLMQQASAFGQFAAPPLVAWLAHRAGGWQWTWVVTGACASVGILLAGRLARRGVVVGVPA